MLILKSRSFPSILRNRAEAGGRGWELLIDNVATMDSEKLLAQTTSLL